MVDRFGVKRDLCVLQLEYASSYETGGTSCWPEDDEDKNDRQMAVP